MFDSMFSDDPQRQAMMMLAAGLLSPVKNRGGAGFAEAMSNGIQGGLLASNQARQNKQRNAQAEMQAKMQQAQLGQLERANADEDFKRSIAPNYFSPGNAPADGMGPVMPPKADLAGYGAALAQRSPEMGLPYMPKPQAPKMAFAPNGEAVDMNALPVGRNFAPQQEAKPDYKDYPSNGRIVRVFNDGKSKVIYDAPEKPEKGPGAPQGYRWSGDRLEPIPGGPADAKVGKEAEALQKRQAGAMERANFVLGKVGDAIDKTGFNTSGTLGAILKNVPGTEAKALQRVLDPIKANIGFAELQAMREASPTGGALGQVAVQELSMLQSVLGSLEQDQPSSELLKSLYAIDKHYKGWKRAVEQSKQQGGQGPNVDDLVKKYGGG